MQDFLNALIYVPVKITSMENGFKFNEILIMTNTSFSNRELPEKNNAADKYLTIKEKLKQACWDGLAPELLPECFDFMFSKSQLLWEINEADAFIDLEYGDAVPVIQKGLSLNPYIFMQVQGYN